MRLSPTQWGQRCVFRRLRWTPGDSWVSGKVHLAFRWWVIAPQLPDPVTGCHCRSDSPWRTRGLLDPSSWQPPSSPESNRTPDWACGCEVRDGRVGGGFRPCREVCFDWLKHDCTVRALWTLMSGFLSQEREREGSTVARTLRCECSTVWQYDPNRLM